MSHVIVMAKSPVPGRVKTRMCPPLTSAQAADLARVALAETLDTVRRCGADRRIVALEGPPGPWIPPGFEVVTQRGGSLADRLTHAWCWAGGPGIQIGMDTPQATAADLDAALATVVEGRAERPAVLGPALDGGWWLIGWRQADPRLVFAGIPTSVMTTGRDQLARLRGLGLTTALTRVLRDLDTIDDLVDLATTAPWSATAEWAASLGGHREKEAM